MMDFCYRLEDVTYSYGRHPVIRGISQDFQKGVFYGILGPNGCGKTTLLDLMAGQKPPTRGRIRLMEEDVCRFSKPELSRKVALVCQNFYIHFPYTVYDIVMMGRYPFISRFSLPAEEDVGIVSHVMALTGVDMLQDHLITELSGGERQRAVFARALAQNTDILLLDEATSNLDIHHTLALLDVVRTRVLEEGITVISVFQDINLAAMYCDRMMFMKDGQRIAEGPTEQMMDEGLLKEVFYVSSKIRFEPECRVKQAVFKSSRNG